MTDPIAQRLDATRSDIVALPDAAFLRRVRLRRWTRRAPYVVAPCLIGALVLVAALPRPTVTTAPERKTPFARVDAERTVEIGPDVQTVPHPESWGALRLGQLPEPTAPTGPVTPSAPTLTPAAARDPSFLADLLLPR